MQGNKTKTSPKRDEKGRLVAGQTANRNGRPKVAIEFRQKARAAVDEHVIDAWVTEVEQQGPKWLEASKLLAEYGYGKPTQAIEHSGLEGTPLGISVKFVSPAK